MYDFGSDGTMAYSTWSSPWDIGRVYGSITLNNSGNTVWASRDTYNFNIRGRSWYDAMEFARNTGTRIGSSVAGKGSEFDIYFKGIIKVPSQRPH